VSGYLSELRANWRPLLAAMIGMGSGMSLVGVITSTIVPSLIADTGWSHSDFAMVGSLAFFMAFAFPFIGRLTDVIGVRWTALIGQVTLPLVYFAYSQMNGQLPVYIAIFIVQSVLCVTTTSTVYTRLPVQYIKKARGLALAIVASGPAFSGAVIAPFLNSYVETHGWRDAYTVVAIGTALAGITCFLLIPRDAHTPRAAAAPKRRARDDYPAIFRNRAFWILAGAMLLCNLPQTLLLVQLKMLLIDNGISGQGAAVMLSASSIGMLAGRFLTGYALDRFRPYFVSFITLALPSMGLFIFASGFDAAPVLTVAVFCLGFAFGAEGDIVGFLVARQFGVTIYSSVLGLLTAIMSFSTASGAMLLGVTMAQTGGFTLYLLISGTAALAGATLLLMLGRGEEPSAEAKEYEETVPHPGVQITGQV
jgi:MFS family permease